MHNHRTYIIHHTLRESRKYVRAAVRGDRGKGGMMFIPKGKLEHDVHMNEHHVPVQRSGRTPGHATRTEAGMTWDTDKPRIGRVDPNSECRGACTRHRFALSRARTTL
jgi:hypothetical protein